MFREVYKQANDEIKGDRQILDKAFLKAAQPVKKTNPILKYSFVGTAAAAVLVVGTVFMNFDIFMDKTKNMPAPDKVTQAEVTTEGNMGQVNEPDVANADVNNETIAPPVTPKQTSGGNEAEDNSVMIASEETGADTGVDTPTGFSIRVANNPDVTDESDDETDAATGGVSILSEEEFEAFSYMYDLSVYEKDEVGVVTEGFVNTTVSPIESSAEAVERAKNECTVEYNATAVYRDSIENMWKVTFYMTDVLGGGESVYLTGDGITTLIVYGE